MGGPTPRQRVAAIAGADAAAHEAALRRAIERARSVPELAAAARQIGALADAACAGEAPVQAATTLISSLNDAVTVAVVQLIAGQMGVDLQQACWLAFGSQARGEQTLATDQDNGLVFAGDDGAADRPAWLAFGQRVNQALAECGYALCDGRVMAGQPLCCLTVTEWCARFVHWMAHGSGNDLLAARIYFDLRPLCGDLALARPLQALLRSPAASVPRFVKQMADIVLCNHVPLDWLGRTRTVCQAGRAHFDLKMSGTALFVDAARLWALALALPEVGTVPRLRAAAPALGLPARELQSWVQGFEDLQRLRLQVQRRRTADADPQQRCWARWDELDAAQRRAVGHALRAARWVQQRIALDYRR
jgi:CBS domain-containing protein